MDNSLERDFSFLKKKQVIHLKVEKRLSYECEIIVKNIIKDRKVL